jgi:hypothetical protein
VIFPLYPSLVNASSMDTKTGEHHASSRRLKVDFKLAIAFGNPIRSRSTDREASCFPNMDSESPVVEL